jgi:NAD(P)-dependent dehydrogenase (short-subunit alcohol dehydrogenase family)
MGDLLLQTKCAAAEDGIRVNTVHPGIIDTPIWTKIPVSTALDHVWSSDTSIRVNLGCDERAHCARPALVEA